MTNLQLYEIKDLKRNLDSKILNLIKEFEEKTCLEVVSVYIERMDATEMSGARTSIPVSAEVQAVLEPVLQPQQTNGGGE